MGKSSTRKLARKPIAIPKDKISELAKSIDAQKMQIRTIVADMKDPERVQREIDRLNKIIAGYFEQVERYQERIARPQEMLNAAHDRLREMQQEYKVLLHAREIEKLRQLQAEIRALQKPRKS